MAEEEFPFRFVPPSDPNIGRCVDGHILTAQIGRGGMGAAYLAAHQALSHSKCVIKLMLAEVARIPQAIVRIQLEAEALSRLNKHDHVVKLQNFGILADGQFYLRFEFIEGVTLQRYVIDQGGLLPLRKAAHLTFQVCNAMDFAHRLGIIHRDLKPENLMIEFNPPGSHFKERLKVLDFGIAKLVHGAVDPTGSGQALGTIRFMAPEQVTNAAAVTGKADVFSLGQVLYLILTGKMPWGTPESDIAIYHKQRTEAPAWPPEELVPEAVARVIMRCLSLNPDDRPTMRELAIELAAAFEGGTEILAKVVPDWVESSPHDATTLPRPAVAEPVITPGRLLIADGIPEGRSHAHLSSDVSNPAARVSASAPPHTPDLPVPTASARPRSLAASLASAAGSSAVPSIPVQPQEPAPVALGDAAARVAQTPPTPLIAALPTGLISQRFDAQEPPEAREPSMVVASEIELAAGTPAGPQPYEHAELPAVMVSNTQLSGAAPPPSAPPAPFPGQPEPPPFIVVPGVPQSSTTAPAPRRKLVVVGLAVCMLAALVAFALMRGSSHDTHNGETHAPAPVADAAGDHAIAHDTPIARPSVSTAPDERLARGSDTSPEAGHSLPAGAGVVGSAPAAAPTVSSQPPSAGAGAPSRAAASAPSRGTAQEVIRPDAGVPANPVAQARPAEPAHGGLTANSRTSPPRETPPATEPVATSGGRGELAILVKPWAAIWLNGRPAGEAPYREKVPAGRYRVRMQNEDLQKDETATVVVAPGRTTTIERNW